MKKRPASKKTFCLEDLLEKQPKSIRRHTYYPVLQRYYDLSPRLKTLRISRRCRSLMDRATVPPENLKYFYRTYNLPRNPFFPLFFLIKREYLQTRIREKERRKDYIAAVMRGLPENILEFIKYLAQYEKGLNARHLYPVWVQQLYPKTKKRVQEYASFGLERWIQFLYEYLLLLETRYTEHTSELSRRLLACCILESLPEPVPPYRPPVETVSKNYRRLCKLYHPDTGGDPEHFVRLKQARDILVKS